jgi:hypothetical protein
MDNSEKDNNFMKSIKWSMYIWIIGTIIASFVQTSFLHSAGMSNIPPEFYGELAGQILAWIVLFVTLPLYLFFKFVKK